MGIDSDAKIDPKLLYFHHIPIIYTQTSVVSVFSAFHQVRFCLNGVSPMGLCYVAVFPVGFGLKSKTARELKKVPWVW